jgi:hypothetical protein
MAAQRVTGVVWWRMGLSHYQSLFRRARKGEKRSGFTRDFLQASSVRPVLLEMFEGREPPYGITYRWSTGSDPNGRIYPAADYDQHGRVDVGQFLGGIPPLPWQIGDPAAAPEITLPGSTQVAIPEPALTQWSEGLKPLEPWLMMVQLDHHQTELHLRAYLGNPPKNLTAASLENVPEILRARMTARSRSAAGGLAAGLTELWFDPSEFRSPWSTTSAAATLVTPEHSGPPAPFGSEYRPGNVDQRSAAADPFEIDPDLRDRGTRAHHETQNAIARIVQDRGLLPRSPVGEPNFDVGWEEADGRLVVVEVKSINSRNAEKQMRLGLGQVLRYRDLLAGDDVDVLALLALSDKPLDSRWLGLCEELGIGLVWRPDLVEMLKPWLG